MILHAASTRPAQRNPFFQKYLNSLPISLKSRKRPVPPNLQNFPFYTSRILRSLDSLLIARAFAATVNLSRPPSQFQKIQKIQIQFVCSKQTPTPKIHPLPPNPKTWFYPGALSRAKPRQRSNTNFFSVIFFPSTTMSFSDFSKVETLKSLNDFLADKSYIDGYVLQNSPRAE